MAVDARHGAQCSPADGPGEWRAETRYPPTTASVRLARRFVEAELLARACERFADDAGLVVTELAGNAVLHARTPFEVVVRSAGAGGVRVDVVDGSSAPPVVGAAVGTAMSGRGMVLVGALASRWGTERTPTGKAVWFEVGGPETPGPEPDEPSADELLAMWADLDTAPTVVVPDLPVHELLAAKEHLDDLVREMQIVMHDPAVADRGEAESPEEVLLARRLDAAVHAFEPARVQVRSQVQQALRAGQARVTLELVLDQRAGEHARTFLEVLDEAEHLSRRGLLLTRGDELGRHAAVRRLYLEEVVRQLG